MTVGDVRKAIEGLPDEAFVSLHSHLSEDSDTDLSGFFARLAEVRSEGGRFVIQIDVTLMCDDIDIDDDDDDFEEED